MTFIRARKSHTVIISSLHLPSGLNPCFFCDDEHLVHAVAGKPLMAQDTESRAGIAGGELAFPAHGRHIRAVEMLRTDSSNASERMTT